MNPRRLLLALFVALAVSAAFTFFVGRKVMGKSKAVNQYVVAARSLEAGEMLKPSNLSLVDWPSSVALEGGFQNQNMAVGRTVLYPLAKGEPIIERQLAAAGSGVGLSAKIPEGMRAISLKSDDVIGVAGFLLPGTHVDVLETDRAVGPSGRPDTSTVLQDVEVLAAGQQMEPDPEGKPIRVPVVTLLLKPNDAEKVVQATDVGTIHFLLRNGSDRTQVASAAPVKDQVVAKVASEHRLRAATPAQTYLVETQMGEKKVVNSFN